MNQSLLRHLLLFPLLGLLLAACMAPAVAPEPVVPAEQMEQQLFVRINRARAGNGLPPFKWAPTLLPVARGQSADMASNGYLGHRDSKGRDLAQRFESSRVTGWREIGENVARSMGYDENDRAMVDGWLKSPPHRANIMKQEYQSTAIGVARSDDGFYYATQVFMR